MFQRIVLWWKRYLLKKLIAKPPPERFNLDNPDNDYVTVDMPPTDDAVRIGVKSLQGDTATCWRWDANHDRTEVQMSAKDVLASELEMRVYKGSLQCFTDRLWAAYSFSCLRGWHAFMRRQRHYDTSLRQYRGRMEVLEAAVRLRERSVMDGNYMDEEFSVEGLTKELYGPLIQHSERAFDVHENVGIKLASFRGTGEISTNDERYVTRFTINPHAYATLADFAADERRHKESVRVQAILVLVTAVLTLVAILQLVQALAK